MNKYIFPIIKWKIKSWLKYYILNNSATSYPLSEITIGTSPLTLSNSVRKKFNIFNVGGNTKQATAILPDEYQQVDYIESSGTQYIDTGVVPSKNLILKYKTTYKNNSNSLFGASKGTYQYTSTISQGAEYYRIFQTQGNIAYSSPTENTLYEVIVQPKKLIYNDDVEYYFSNQSIETYTNSLYLFARNIDGVASNFGSRRIYYFKMYVSGVLTRDFIPCYRKSDNVVGLYDIVNKTFYTNAGTGAFTYGTAVTLPNPDFPIEVENVSGEVEVKVENKNLCTNENIGMNTPILSNIYGIYTGAITIAVKTTSGTAQVNYRINYEDGTVYNNYVMTANQANDVWRIAKYTTTKPIKSIGLYYISSGGTARIPEHIMFLKGTYNTITDADYVPHEEQTATLSLPEGMEMCKIGDVQDSFVYQGGKWYKQANIGKTNVKTTWDWSKNADSPDGNYISFMTYAAPFFKSGVNVLCNYFVTGSWSAIQNKNGNYCWNNSQAVGGFRIHKDYLEGYDASMTNAEKIVLFKNWLSANPDLLVYYKKTTATLEEITDPTLISDLENLKNLYSYKGTTYISSTNEPSPVFEVQYYMEGDDV